MSCSGSEAEASENRSGIWTRLWESGPLHSCAPGADLFTEPFWRQFFQAFTASASLLDIGTGNGLIPLLAARNLARVTRMCGIDSARIKPDIARYPELAAVEFRSGIDAERLPFADGCFNIITSQFAVEYTDVSATLSELIRLIAPAGSIALVMHAADSHISTVSRTQIDQLVWVGRSGGFIDAASRMVHVLGARQTVVAASDEHERVREHYNQCARALIQRLEGAREGDVLARAAISVQRALAEAARRPANGEHAIAHLRLALEDEAARLHKQLEAACTSAQIDEVVCRLEGVGFAVETGDLHHAGKLMARTLMARR